MGKKRRLRANNPKFSKKHSTHPRMLKDEKNIDTQEPVVAKLELQNKEPAVVEKPKPTRKRKPTTTRARKQKTTTRKTKATEE